MKKWLMIFLMIATLLTPVFADVSPPDIVDTMIDVVYDDGSVETRHIETQMMMNSLSVANEGSDDPLPYDTAVTNALSEPGVARVEPVYLLTKEAFIPDDVLNNPQASFYDGWKFDVTGQQAIWQQVFDRYVTADKTPTTIVVAVIDDGVTVNHADLNVLSNGYDFANGDNDPNPTSGSHGNHVAGIVGAIGNNSSGTIGVYPNVSILPVKVFTDVGGGNTSYLDDAIIYAVDQGAHVINMSLSYGGHSTAVLNAIKYAQDNGVIVVVAAGNDSSLWDEGNDFDEEFDSSNKGPNTVRFPAAHAESFTVGSVQYVNNQVAMSDFSSVAGSVSGTGYSYNGLVSVVAPGSQIYSTYNGTDGTTGGPFTNKSGTSMATPYVSGLFALLKAEYPTASAAQLKAIVTSTALTALVTPTIGGYTDQDLRGGGLVQVASALAYYKPTDISLSTKSGGVETSLNLGYHPLVNTYSLATLEASDTFSLTVTGTANTGEVRVNGQVAVGGQATDLGLGGGNNVITIEVDTTLGTTQTYTINLSNLASDNANLASISFGGSSLVLDGSSQAYTLVAPASLTSFDLTVAPVSPAATVTINTVAQLNQTINLSAGDNVITIEVTAQDGVTTKTYTLTVKKDASIVLHDLLIDYYNASDVLIANQSVTIAHSNFTNFDKTMSRPALATYAKVTYNYGAEIKPYTLALGPVGQGAYSLSNNTNDSTYSVTVPFTTMVTPIWLDVTDGSSLQYTLTFESDAPYSSQLTTLGVVGYTLSPEFAPGTLTYALTVPFAVDQVTVQASNQDDRNTLTLDGDAVTEKIINLTPGDNMITVVNQAPDLSQTTYTLTITRVVDTDASLEKITFDNSSVTVTGSPGAYSAKVKNNQASVTLNVLPTSSVATVKINNESVSTKTLTLNPGSNPVSVVITAEDGVTQTTYSLDLVKDTVMQLGALSIDLKGAADSTVATYNLNHDNFNNPAGVHWLTYANTALKVDIDYDHATYLEPYTISVSSDLFDDNIHLTTSSPLMTLPLGGERTGTTITIGNGDTSLDYTLILDADTALSASYDTLSLTATSLSPAYNINTTIYTVPNTTTSVVINAIAADERMLVSINGQVTTSRTLSLNEGVNTLTILNYSNPDYYNGSLSEANVYTITREAAPVDTGGSGGSGGSTPPPAPAPAPPPVAIVLPPPVQNTTTSTTTDDSGVVIDDTVVSEAYLSSLLTDTEVEIKLNPPSSSLGGSQLSLSKDNLTAIKNSNKPLGIVFNAIKVVLPPEVIKNASSGLAIKVKPSQSKATSPLAAVYDFSLSVNNQSVSAFVKPLTITFDYNTKAVKNPDKVSVFYFNTQTQSWEFAGGKIIAQGKITAPISHFSTYTVNEFDITFDDIKDHWAKNTVEIMASKMITKGVSDTTFAPDDALTNAQFITLISRILALPDKASGLPFSDISMNGWYVDAVKKAYAHGILTGAYSTTLSLDEPISREVMATVLVNAYAYQIGVNKADMLLKEEVAFKDMQGIDAKHLQDIKLSYQLGLIKGMPDGGYYPKQGATRAEAMTVLLRLMKLF